MSDTLEKKSKKRLLPHQKYLRKRKEKKELIKQEQLDKLQKILYQQVDQSKNRLEEKLPIDKEESISTQDIINDEKLESGEIDKLVEKGEWENDERLKEELLAQQKYHQEQLELTQKENSLQDEIEILKRTKITNDFMFQIMNYETERQNGRTLNILVKYRYAIDPEKFYSHDQVCVPNYIPIRQLILNDILDYDKYSKDIFWEVLGYSIAKEVYLTYKLIGTSIQIQVEPSFNISPVEPGVHGCITTIGDMSPWDNVVPYQPKPGIL